jgi:peptidoglycan/xylan/chitin deacetylase (PgdA/CDA1 family)
MSELFRSLSQAAAQDEDEERNHLREAVQTHTPFETLYEEGSAAPKMMSVGLHCRLSGRPGRSRSLERFLDLVQSRDRVWLCRRIEIANHWHTLHRPGRG